MWELVLLLALREIPGRHIEMASPVAGIYATQEECARARDLSYTRNDIPAQFRPRGSAAWTQAGVGLCLRRAAIA